MSTEGTDRDAPTEELWPLRDRMERGETLTWDTSPYHPRVPVPDAYQEYIGRRRRGAAAISVPLPQLAVEVPVRDLPDGIWGSFGMIILFVVFFPLLALSTIERSYSRHTDPNYVEEPYANAQKIAMGIVLSALGLLAFSLIYWYVTKKLHY